MKITVPTAKLCLKTYQPQIMATFFVAVYDSTIRSMVLSFNDVVAVARGPPL